MGSRRWYKEGDDCIGWSKFKSVHHSPSATPTHTRGRETG